MGHVGTLKDGDVMTCLICYSHNSQMILNEGSFPYFTVPVAKKDKISIFKKYKKESLFGELCYWACKDCGHVQINKLPNKNILDDLYKKYYTYPSPLKNTFEPLRDDYFVNYFKSSIDLLCRNRKLNSILEVGCYDGYILDCLKREGYETQGCDPSEGAKIGQSFGLDIRREYFCPDNFVKENLYYDIVISRHFIEHVFDPFQYLNDFGKVLKTKGLLILETPNVEHFLEKGLLEVFSLQHISLFSEDSLSIALAKSGFEVISVNKSTENLIMTSTKSSKVEITKNINNRNLSKLFIETVNRNKSIINESIKDSIDFEKSIAIWGAGGFGVAALRLYNIPERSIDYFIDSDPEKWKKEYINTTIPIVSPSYAEDHPPSILIVASMYSKSILENLPTSFNKTKKLILTPHVALIK